MVDASAAGSSGEGALSLGRKAAQSGALLIGARLLARLIDLGTMLILARLLRPRDFGLVAIAMTVVSVAEAVLELPLSQALLRLPVVTRSQLDTAFTLSLLRGGLLAAVTAIAAWPLAIAYGDHRLIPLVSVLSLSPILRGLTSPRMITFQKQMSFWRDFIIETGGKLVGFVAGFTAAVVLQNYWALAAGTVAYPMASILVSYWFAPYRPRLSLTDLSVFLGFSGWYTFAQIISAMNWQFERLLLGKLVPLARLGLFTTASDIVNIPVNAFVGPMLRPLLAAFAGVQGDKERLVRTYQISSAAIATVGLPILVGECLLADPMIRFIFGEKWLGAIPLLRWLSLSLIPSLFAQPAAPLLMSLGDTRVFLWRNATEFLVKVPLVVIGAVDFGFLGVVAARICAESAAALYCTIVVKRLLGLSLRRQISNTSRSIVSVSIMALPLLVFDHFVPSGIGPVQAGLSLASGAVVGATAYCLSLLCLWLATGQPAGLETMVFNGIATRLTRGKGLQPQVR